MSRRLRLVDVVDLVDRVDLVIAFKNAIAPAGLTLNKLLRELNGNL